MLTAAMLAGAAGCVALAVDPGVGVGYLAMVLIGFVLLPAMPIVLELVERSTGEAEGTGAGLIWMVGNLGGFAVAAVVGPMVDHPVAAFLIMGATALAAVPVVGLLRKPVAELSTVEPVTV
ncbi:MAG TPA: hypothetical protein VM677_07880 [Actinokineospora sp.]|nr:hypothetical protein [Actinokineospora sp.]